MSRQAFDRLSVNAGQIEALYRPRELSWLHPFWHLNTQQFQALLQPLLNDLRECQQESLSERIEFNQDAMLVVEVVKGLRQAEEVLGDSGRLRHLDRERNIRLKLSREINELP